MKPYYEHAGVTIYHGDCRDLIPSLAFDTVITDPVWPNASVPLIGADDPARLLHGALVRVPSAKRVAVAPIQIRGFSRPSHGAGRSFARCRWKSSGLATRAE